MRRYLLLLPVGLVVLFLVVCGSQPNAGRRSTPAAERAEPTAAATPASAPATSPTTTAAIAAAAQGGQQEPTPPAGAVELAPGDYGLRRSGDQPEPTLSAVGVSCSAPNLLALQTQAETFYFWTYVAPNFDCEQMRRTLLLAAVPEAQLSEATAVFGRLVGFHYTKMDQASPVGAFQVSANWKDGGSVLFVVLKGWRGPTRP